MGTPSRDRDGEKTKRFRERWCKHRDQKSHSRMEVGRDRETERGDKPEIQTEEETGSQPNCFFSRGPAGACWEGLGSSLWCLSGAGTIQHWEAPEMQCGCPDQGLGEARGRRAQILGQGGEAGALDSWDRERWELGFGTPGLGGDSDPLL